MTEAEKATARLLINPVATVKITDKMFVTHKPASSKEDWVLLNAELIKSIGAPAWLNDLLDALSLSKDEYDGHEIANPALAIAISDKLRTGFTQSIEREDWIKANAKLISEVGAAEWLWLLLEVLEAGSS